MTDLWQDFCSHHHRLFDLTCEEYEILLSGNIDDLEKIIGLKKDIVSSIKTLEEKREKIVKRLSVLFNTKEEISSVSDFIIVMKKYGVAVPGDFFERYNSLLIDLIEKIQDQNVKNQVFLNKSLLSLKEIREGILGNKSYKTYNEKGTEYPLLK